MTLVSLVFTNYNYARFLPEALDSALAQTSPDIEVIVVENASTDNSLAVLEPYRADPRVRVVELKKNIGVAGGWNEGFRHSHGDFVAFMSTDDHWPSDFVDRSMAKLVEHPEAAMSYGRVEIFGDVNPVRKSVMSETFHYGELSREKFFRRLLSHNFIPQATCLYRRKCLEEEGLFDPKVKITVDYDLLFRLCLKHPVLFIDHQLAFYRWHGSNSAYSTRANQLISFRDKAHSLKKLLRERKEPVQSLGMLEEANEAYRKTLKRLVKHNLGANDFQNSAACARDLLRTGRHPFWSLKAMFYCWVGHNPYQAGNRYRDCPSVKPVEKSATRPLVSILIPSYNHAAYLRECLESAIAQTLKDREIIVIDDGSNDGSTAILKDYEGRDDMRIIRQANQGISRTFTRCVRESRGHYIAFLCSDDVWLPDHLERSLKHLENTTPSRMVYSRAKIIGDSGNELPAETMPTFMDHHTGEVFEELLWKNFIPFQTVVLERSLLEEHGGFDSSIDYAQDWDLWLRITPYIHLTFSDHVTTCYRWHGGNQSNVTSFQKSHKGHREHMLFVERAIATHWKHILMPRRTRNRVLYRIHHRLAKRDPRRIQRAVHYAISIRYKPYRIENYVKVFLALLGLRGARWSGGKHTGQFPALPLDTQPGNAETPSSVAKPLHTEGTRDRAD